MLIAKLSRSKVPFAWLDSASSSTQIPARLVFHAELPTASHSHSVHVEDDIVWVGRQAPNGRLYAVESLGGNTHVGYLLSGWLTEEEVIAGPGSVSKKALLERLLSNQQVLVETENSSRLSSHHGVPVQSFRISPRKPKNRRGALARMSIMPSKETTPISRNPVLSDPDQQQQPLELDTSQSNVNMDCAGQIMPTSSTTPAQDTQSTLEAQTSTLQPLQQETEFLLQLDSIDSAPPNTQTILETLHRQYLETLYTSKTSLAYFAKGPLARARSQLESSPTSHSSHLADFCRNSIVPTKKMDLKYRESIVSILQSLTLVEAPNGTEQLQKASTKSKTKPKSSKQRKLGKDGLYPSEEEFVVSWWNGKTLKDSDIPTDESRAREIKTAVADLRSRETEMQVLLMLEALALETAEIPTISDTASNSLVKDEPSESRREAMLTEIPQFKKKDRQDLRSELELLIDRLCIWHTLGFEHVPNAFEGNQEVESGPAFPSKDRVRDFCSDVMIPFYSARLPEQCKAICQKLGGPPIWPKRQRKTLQKSLSSSKVLPGAAMKHSHGSISKRTLQRVLSEDQSSRHASPPLLLRSSTVPLVPNFKRETTEPPQRPESRGGLQKSRSFANREIDLVSDARSQDAKQKKLANLAKQKQEIDAAITALRKPNRGLAAKEIADEIERHRLEGAKVTKLHGVGIQVSATPKKSKHNSAGQGSGFQSGPPVGKPLAEAPLNELSVPSSTMRPSMGDQAYDRTVMSTTRRAVPITVNGTPVHDAVQRPGRLGMAKHSQGFEIFTTNRGDSGHLNKVKYNAVSLIQATPSAKRLRPDMLTSIQNTPLRMNNSQRPVLFTPMIKADIMIEDAFRDAPEIPEQAGKAMARVMGGGSEMSIYDSLGWNDDFDD